MSDTAAERSQWKEQWKTESWELFMSSPATGVLWTRVSGQADMDCALHIMRAFDWLASMTKSRLDVFHDWEAVTGYGTEVRQELTRWALENPGRTESVHVLVGSRIVAMGVTVANVALGGIVTAHHERAKFEKLRTETIARRRRASIG
jgi:hypothetical protein